MKTRQLWKKGGAVLLTLIMTLTACNRYSEKTEQTSRWSLPSVAGIQVSESGNERGEDSHSVFYVTPPPSEIVEADDDLAEELKKIPGVVKVGRRESEVNNFDENQYLVYYEMPIDHNDPSKGTFIQRLYINYKGKDAPNVFNISGYNIYYGLHEEKESQLAKRYDCNLIEPEYRFDGQSKPEGFSETTLDYWEYLNCAQASEDFHFMIEGLKTVLSGKWCIEGISKGGEFTAYQAGAHPEDADLFVAESAMVKCNNGYPGLSEYCYTTAGNETFGEEEAKEYREMLLEFQVELIKNREVLQDRYWDLATHTYNIRFSPTLTKEILFDCTVHDLCYIWQYALQEEFETIKEALARRAADGSSNNEAFYQKAISTMEELYGPWQFAVSDPGGDAEESEIYNFFFQCAVEDGYYAYDFSYLRKALAEDGSGASLYVTEDMEKDLYLLRINDIHQKQFKYNPEVTNIRVNAIETTQKPMILVNPTTDVHYIAEVKECSNPNVHIFPVSGGGHGDAEWQHLTQEQQKEYDQVVRQALGIGEQEGQEGQKAA